jgi:hypothetical protein
MEGPAPLKLRRLRLHLKWATWCTAPDFQHSRVPPRGVGIVYCVYYVLTLYALSWRVGQRQFFIHQLSSTYSIMHLVLTSTMVLLAVQLQYSPESFATPVKTGACYPALRPYRQIAETKIVNFVTPKSRPIIAYSTAMNGSMFVPHGSTFSFFA